MNKALDEKKPAVNSHMAGVHVLNNMIVLATAKIEFEGPNGLRTPARALLDQGSEASFISESLVQLLSLPKRRVEIALYGIGASDAGIARGVVNFHLHSLIDTDLS